MLSILIIKTGKQIFFLVLICSYTANSLLLNDKKYYIIYFSQIFRKISERKRIHNRTINTRGKGTLIGSWFHKRNGESRWNDHPTPCDLNTGKKRLFFFKAAPLSHNSSINFDCPKHRGS